MTVFEATLVFFGGLIAGGINSMAGGGSLLTVPLLDVAGVTGLLANGTNRVAVLFSNGTSAYSYAKRGVDVWRRSIPVVIPSVVGGLVGATLISNLDDAAFKKLFGVLMIPLLAMALWKPRAKTAPEPWPASIVVVVFFLVGIYAGAIQAGVGLFLVLLLARAGYDLVEANALKTIVILGVSATAVPVFVAKGQVSWLPAVVLAAGMGLGGYVGAKFAVEGGERVIRPVLVVSVVALAGRMVGLY
ncbi:MAG: sulfite exporter TauE/SafE family protein [Acidimicrobiales bacterium]